MFIESYVTHTEYSQGLTPLFDCLAPHLCVLSTRVSSSSRCGGRGTVRNQLAKHTHCLHLIVKELGCKMSPYLGWDRKQLGEASNEWFSLLEKLPVVVAMKIGSVSRGCSVFPQTSSNIAQRGVEAEVLEREGEGVWCCLEHIQFRWKFLKSAPFNSFQSLIPPVSYETAEMNFWALKSMLGRH